jgi:hypothetical protein
MIDDRILKGALTAISSDANGGRVKFTSRGRVVSLPGETYNSGVKTLVGGDADQDRRRAAA